MSNVQVVSFFRVRVSSQHVFGFLSQEQFREIAPTANVLEDGFYANKENLSNIDRTIQTHGPQTLISNRQHKRRHKNKQLKTRSPVQSLEVSAVLLTQSKYQ